MPEDQSDFPKVTPLFLKDRPDSSFALYENLIVENLKKVIPSYIFSSEKTKEEQFSLFRQAVPLLTWSEIPKQTPCEVSFFLICRLRSDAFRFFYDMISRWLIPHRRVPIPLLYAVDFSFNEIEGETYSLVEVIVHLENAKDLQALKRNLWIMEAEIHIGADSHYKANRILEVKGLTGDEKTALMHEDIVSLLRRKKEFFGEDIFVEMQHFLVVCTEEFKSLREHSHMSRIISVLYIFRKQLQEALEKNSDKRYIYSKLIRATLNSHMGKERNVLGCLVLLNFTQENEVFEERHFLDAIQSLIPRAIDVAGSFFTYQSKMGANCALYIEVEPKDKTPFTIDEIKRLRTELEEELRSRIEQLMHAVFMPRNEEEITKNIIILRDELQYSKDVPQVLISFDEQTSTHLTYTVILLRVRKSGMQPIKDLFYQTDTFLDFTLDREKVVGDIRKIHQKEATVFRLRLRKDAFLRKNRAVDLSRARQKVVKELKSIIGPFRDYNGGLIAKQEELLTQTKELLKEQINRKEYLFETFFYALSPDYMRSILSPDHIKVFFGILLELIQSESLNDLNVSDYSYYYFVKSRSDLSFRNGFKRYLSQCAADYTQIISFSLEHDKQFIDGAMVLLSEKEKLEEACLYSKNENNI